MRKAISAITGVILSLTIASCGDKNSGSTVIAEAQPASDYDSAQASAQPASQQTSVQQGSRFSTSVDSIDKLPDCTAAREGFVYWVLAEKNFYICAQENYDLLDFTGSKGTNGADGATGSNGSDSLSTVLLDSTGTKIGLLFHFGDIASSDLVQLAGGGFFSVDIKTGAYISAPSLATSGIVHPDTTCSFLSANCSGVCYHAPLQPTDLPMKNSIFAASPTSLFIVTGTEVIANGLTFASYMNISGVCTTDSYTQNAFAITTPYALPDGLTLPFSGPLYVGSSAP